MSRADRIRFAEVAATYFHDACGTYIERCWDIYREESDPVVKAGIRAAIDQLRLEELMGLRTRGWDPAIGMYIYIEAPEGTAAVVGEARLDSLSEVAGNVFGGGGGNGLGGCPGDCDSLHPSAAAGPTSTAELRTFMRIAPGSGVLHHLVAQNVGNVVQFGLVNIHSPDNVVLMTGLEHIAVHANQSRMYDSEHGITYGEALSVFSFGSAQSYAMTLLYGLGIDN